MWYGSIYLFRKSFVKHKRWCYAIPGKHLLSSLVLLHLGASEINTPCSVVIDVELVREDHGSILCNCDQEGTETMQKLISELD
jgi:hypothetical protein